MLTCKAIGKRSVAALKSYPNEQLEAFALTAHLFQDAVWSKVPSFGSDLRKENRASCNGFSIDCVHTSTIAKTLIFPAGSFLVDNCPTWLPLPSLIKECGNW